VMIAALVRWRSAPRREGRSHEAKLGLIGVFGLHARGMTPRFYRSLEPHPARGAVTSSSSGARRGDRGLAAGNSTPTYGRCGRGGHPAALDSARGPRRPWAVVALALLAADSGAGTSCSECGLGRVFPGASGLASQWRGRGRGDAGAGGVADAGHLLVPGSARRGRGRGDILPQRIPYSLRMEGLGGCPEARVRRDDETHRAAVAALAGFIVLKRRRPPESCRNSVVVAASAGAGAMLTRHRRGTTRSGGPASLQGRWPSTRVRGLVLLGLARDA